MIETNVAGEAVVRSKGLCKAFMHRGVRKTALHGVDLTVCRGEVVAVVGRSGEGKSTLLNILGMLDRPDRGAVELVGRDVTRLADGDAARMRARSIGFVFQTMNLLAHLSVLRNIELGVHPTGGRLDTELVKELLGVVGLSGQRSRKAFDLSLGEQQRVAVVRALAKRPDIILADEPTGSLDREHEHVVMDLLRRAATTGSAVVVVTHSDAVASSADRVYSLADGRLSVRGA